MTAVTSLVIRPGERLTVHSCTVQPDWIDYNGHMNVAYYVLAFDQAVDALFDFMGLNDAYRARHNASTFALETHICYLQEVHLGDPLRFEIQLLDLDEKRFHYINHMIHDETGALCATAEWISAHMDMSARRVAPFRSDVMDRFRELWAAHRDMPWPAQAGSRIGIRRRPPTAGEAPEAAAEKTPE